MKHILIIPIIAALSACGDLKPTSVPVSIKTEPIQRPNLTLPPIDRIRSRDVEWIVLTPDNVDEVFAELTANGQAVVVFALTADGYENVSLNTRDALKIILQQEAVISGYKQYYTTVDQTISTHNSKISK